jgi:hypothetical protein
LLGGVIPRADDDYDYDDKNNNSDITRFNAVSDPRRHLANYSGFTLPPSVTEP